MNHQPTRLLLAAGAAATAIAAVAAIVGPSAATAASRHPQAPTTVNDYWEQTHHNIHISTTGSVETPIMSLALPAGKWVLHADQTIVNFGPSGFAGCSIADSSNSNLNTHRTIVGNPNSARNFGAAPLATVLSETAAVSVTAPTKVTILCEHDISNGASPYIDANADLWAHRSASLVITQLP